MKPITPQVPETNGGGCFCSGWRSKMPTSENDSNLLTNVAKMYIGLSA